MGAHALLSASSSHRWLHCTPSARLEEKLAESTSEYAEEGSLAHEIAELRLRKYCIEPIGARTFNARIKKLKENPLYQEEAFKVLIDNGFEETMLYERKPLTLSETEKLVGKTKFKELLGSLVHTPPGKPTLVLCEGQSSK
jgi:hypothetical protein